MSLDLYLEFNEDLVLTPSGSLQLAQGWNHDRERIIRNLITNPAIALPDGSQSAPDYIFVPSYGLGLGAHVDSNPTAQDLADMERSIRQAVFADANIDPGTVPTIIFQEITPSAFNVFVSVALASTTNAIAAPTGSFSLNIG